jgi:hypothetical protein
VDQLKSFSKAFFQEQWGSSQPAPYVRDNAQCQIGAQICKDVTKMLQKNSGFNTKKNRTVYNPVQVL